ncbi:MAG: GGDEF domain-containing protein [Spirochaetaceae bacterium]|jgi:diguanylate cyclase (GGDEF)-like protein|nr:GGDEF domain-containing protein [Spirochaetaceae bacterium]
MLPLFSFLHHYSFSREALEDCGENILKNNIRSLMVISMLTGILLVVFAVIHLTMEERADEFVVLLAASMLEFLIFVYASHLVRAEKYAVRFFYSGFTLFVLTSLLFGIYADVFIRRDQNSTIFVVLLICFQAVFHIKALYKLLLIVAMAFVFSAAAVLLKPAEFWRADLLEMATAVLVSIVLSWYMSYTTIKEILTTEKLLKDRDRFREESVRDELTGLSNRREYQNVVRFYINANQHVHQTVCAIMLDVDFFKNYNDHYGHQKGDEVLKAIGGVLKQIIREEKVFAARVGGEEFIVLWTENRIAEAERVAIKLLNMIVDLKIPHERSSVAPYVTASLGLYVLRGGNADTVEDLYREADYALYEAKARGRNCIILRDSADKSIRKVEVVSQEENLGRRQDQPNKGKK